MTVGNYGSKNTPIGPLDAEKIAEAVFLFVFTMAFPMLPSAILELTYVLTNMEEDAHDDLEY